MLKLIAISVLENEKPKIKESEIHYNRDYNGLCDKDRENYTLTRTKRARLTSRISSTLQPYFHVRVISRESRM